jgi:NAD(P)-dependent dehydrogenase (short-subunit alcohol dehydrogenase family)
VNPASIAGLLSGVAFIGPYAAAKAAVVSISETLSQELAIAQLPIGVSVLCPRSVNTRVMESDRSGRFWIITHPGERPLLETRFAGALSEFPHG